ncbi:MAG: amidase [Roseibium sp.]|nr:amidase [Roseibium sp.]
MNVTLQTKAALDFDASAAARQIKDGRLSSVALVTACLERIKATDDQLKAWAHLDPDKALAEAEEMDAIRRSGRPLGPLHGVPVGLKDIIDTRDCPTERGSPIFAGRQPDADAAVVDRLRDAGAVILGKTVTTEVAFVHPADTVNPHDPSRTPGGSSSGSAAAVAAYQVPLALGTQTNGSVIRPASFCGTYGFKPTRGVISRRGILQTSVSLDQVGVFARSLEDVALLTDVLKGFDPQDAKSYSRPRPAYRDGFHEDPPVEPVLAYIELPFADRIAEDTGTGFQELITSLGARAERVAAPPMFKDLVEAQRIIHEYEICQHLKATFDTHWAQISATLRPVIERGRSISANEHAEALDKLAAAEQYFGAFFKDYDAILSPAAPGEAPPLGPTTGDPIFCTIWTLAGLPALSMPLLVGDHGLPIGVQLIAGQEEDARLMRTARWLLETLRGQSGD